MYNLIIALLLHAWSYLMVQESYCSGDLHVILQYAYPIYAIKPFACEYKYAEPVVRNLPDNSVMGVYSYFKSVYVYKYVDKRPPFKEIIIEKNQYGTFKNSDLYITKFSLLLITARHPVKEVLESKMGDCDDYSTTLYVIYKLLGYKDWIIIIKLRNVLTGEKIQHEILVVKDEEYYYLIDVVNDFIVFDANPDNLMKEYESVLLYYTIDNYWVFNDSLFPSKSIK